MGIIEDMKGKMEARANNAMVKLTAEITIMQKAQKETNRLLGEIKEILKRR